MSSEKSNYLQVMKSKRAKLSKVISVFKNGVNNRINLAKQLHGKCKLLELSVTSNSPFSVKSAVVKLKTSEVWKYMNFQQSRTFKCRECSYSTKWINNLREHAVKKHKTKGKRMFKCDVEGCSFRSYFHCKLKKHNKTVHLKIRPFKCGFGDCQYSAATRQNLFIHKSTHSKSKRFKCSYENCAYVGKRKDNLSKHQKIHSNLRPYKCDYKKCSFATKWEANLKCHRWIHDKKKPYKCDKCDYATAWQQQIYRHKAIHSSLKLKCSFKNCNYQTNAQQNLNAHKRRSHRKQ